MTSFSRYKNVVLIAKPHIRNATWQVLNGPIERLAKFNVDQGRWKLVYTVVEIFA